MPAWTVVPFVALLLAIAFLPFLAPSFWHANRNKLILSLAFSVPVAVYLLAAAPEGGSWLKHAIQEYAAFIALMAALYVITGGIRLKGSAAGTPLSNTAILAFGALIASFVGTTGASMLLIRPLLRANVARVRKAHLVVFFIFIVSNAGGLLTPLGDPPLYLGFLRGVPFLWTFHLVGPWLAVNAALLVVFNLVDQAIFSREERDRPGSQLEEVQKIREPLGIEGGLNLAWLAALVGVIYAAGAWGSRVAGPDATTMLQVGAFALLALGSWFTSRREVRAANRFTWSPVLEVAALFIGIFITMVPALKLVEVGGGKLGLGEPWKFFWATGLVSSMLDNAPTYLTFATLAAGLKGVDPLHLETLIAAGGAPQLAAISCGAVFFGAMTYIGNGPNFMVKAIAESYGVKMPGFFGYMAWSTVVLIPLFVLVTLVFF